MPTFSYKAIDQLGLATKGKIEAQNEIDLEHRLNHIGLDLITFRLSKKSTFFINRSRISKQELAMFCFQLEQLTGAGVPILAALHDISAANENVFFQHVIAAISADVEGGQQLSQALAKQPNIFDAVFVSLIEAGEKTGQLNIVFKHLFNNIRWQDELSKQTKRLLAYPIFVSVVVFATVVFLMIYLVPEMVEFLKNTGQALPLNTVILIAVANAFQHFWWLILSVPLLIFLVLAVLINTSANARYQFDSLKLKLPFTGNILHKIIMARFARYFALMYQAGIPILEAIKVCEKIVANQVIANALNRVYSQINAGDAMSDSFQNAGLFTPLIVRMIKVGESTGAIDQSLLSVSYFYNRDVDDAIQKMLSLIEPALTVILGIVLAFIIFSVLGPIYNSFSHLNI